jgi:hypothetical protein
MLRGLAIAVCAAVRPVPKIPRRSSKCAYTTVQSQVYVLVDDSARHAKRQGHVSRGRPNPRIRSSRASGTSKGVDALTRLRARREGSGDVPPGCLDTPGLQHVVRLFRFSAQPRVIRDLGELIS